MTDPRRGRPGYDRQGVLDIAVRAFNEHGYDATSMGTLATRLGLSKSAIYHHFASKEQLLDAALDEALGGLEGVLTERSALEGSPAARLQYVLGRAVHVLVERLPYVTLLLRLRGNTPVERAALDRRREFDRAITALVVEARDAGELRADIDPRVAERLLFGMINSIVEWYRPEGPEDAARLAADVLAFAADGLRMPRG
ncbi:MAG TPA: TetR/AcrR family transcriptional regulator [Pseudolysinimonas sp.]|jgi:AcrR family transcriptional regulator|nr:TetR/AcrR family transcriptional regulator [Pseudolysinimonas sp.]